MTCDTSAVAAVHGVDLGKTIFHVVSLDDRGAVIRRAKFKRDALLGFFERAPRSIVGMEACPGSQWLARKLLAMGHRVRIIPALEGDNYDVRSPTIKLAKMGVRRVANWTLPV